MFRCSVFRNDAVPVFRVRVFRCSGVPGFTNSPSTDHHNIEEQIAIEEDVLDKIFTELKSSQSSLEMAIARSSVCQADATDIVTDSDKSVNLKTVAVSPGLTEDKIMHVVTSTMDDFRVEYGE